MRYDHHKKTQERSLRKEVGGVVIIRAQRYYSTTLRLVLPCDACRSIGHTEACMYDVSAAISSALSLLSTLKGITGRAKTFLIRKKKLSLG